MADGLTFPCERISRLVHWRSGVPVRLASEEIWHLPIAEAGPIEEGGDGWATIRLFVHGSDCQELTEAYYWATELTRERGSAPPYPLDDHFRLMIGVALLRANYAVSHFEAACLMRHAFEMRGDMNAISIVHASIRRAFDSDSIRRIERGLPRDARQN